MISFRGRSDPPTLCFAGLSTIVRGMAAAAVASQGRVVDLSDYGTDSDDEVVVLSYAPAVSRPQRCAQSMQQQAPSAGPQPAASADQPSAAAQPSAMAAAPSTAAAAAAEKSPPWARRKGASRISVSPVLTQ